MFSRELKKFIKGFDSLLFGRALHIGFSVFFVWIFGFPYSFYIEVRLVGIFKKFIIGVFCVEIYFLGTHFVKRL